jgi:hypothetical protein
MDKKTRSRGTKLLFKHSSKRRRSFPSETRVKLGRRTVHGDKDLAEKPALLLLGSSL